MPPNSDALNALLALGVPKARATYALKEFDGDIEAAGDWCFTVRSQLVSRRALELACARGS
jgi:hypothetical protein